MTRELIADPETRIVEVHDSEGRFERIDSAKVEMYSPAILPDLVLPLRAIFAEMDIPDIAEKTCVTDTHAGGEAATALAAAEQAV